MLCTRARMGAKNQDSSARPGNLAGTFDAAQAYCPFSFAHPPADRCSLAHARPPREPSIPSPSSPPRAVMGAGSCPAAVARAYLRQLAKAAAAAAAAAADSAARQAAMRSCRAATWRGQGPVCAVPCMDWKRVLQEFWEQTRERAFDVNDELVHEGIARAGLGIDDCTSMRIWRVAHKFVDGADCVLPPRVPDAAAA